MAEIKFEDLLKKLEKIVSDLENEDISLDESLKKYEEGVRLSHVLSKKLDSVQKRVEMLIRGDNGEFKTVPLDKETIEKDE